MLQTSICKLCENDRQPQRRLSALREAGLKVQVWIDFDGTITQTDVLDALIGEFAVDESWKAAESRWLAGEIGSYECLQSEFAALRIDADQVDNFLQTIPVDPGAIALFTLLRTSSIPFVILSDGIESFISSILCRVGAGHVVTRANRIVHRERSLRLLCPHQANDCHSRAAHCKCKSAQTLGDPNRLSIYIGDGRSDLCAARKADFVFAKGALARLLQEEGQAYQPFDCLNDVVADLVAAWAVK